ncbi:MAG: tetratricopeptide repeat protein [Cyanobacteriota/Melainabacteria group bacterium]
MNSDSFDKDPREGASTPEPVPPADEKKSGDRREIFSLDSIDDSWLDETDIFVRGKDGQLTRKKNPAAAQGPVQAPVQGQAPAPVSGPAQKQAAPQSPPQPPPPPAVNRDITDGSTFITFNNFVDCFAALAGGDSSGAAVRPAAAPPPPPPPPSGSRTPSTALPQAAPTSPVSPTAPPLPGASDLSGGYGIQGCRNVPGAGVIPGPGQSRSTAENVVSAPAAAKRSLNVDPAEKQERENYHFWVENTGSMRLHGQYLPFGSRSVSTLKAVASASTAVASADPGPSLSSAIVSAVSPAEPQSEFNTDNKPELGPEHRPEPVSEVVPDSRVNQVPETPPVVEAPFRQTESTHPPSSIELQPDNPFSLSGAEALNVAPEVEHKPEKSVVAAENTVVVSPAKSSDNVSADQAPVDIPVKEASPAIPATPPAPPVLPTPPTGAPKRMPAAFRTAEPEAQSDGDHVHTPAPGGAFARDKASSGAGVSFKLIVAGLVVLGVMGGVGIYQLSRFLESKPASVQDKNDTDKAETKEAKNDFKESGKDPSKDSGSVEEPKLVSQWARDFDKGVKFFDSKNYDKAIVFFTTSIADDSTHPEVYHLRGKAYIQNKRYEDAIQDFSRAIKLKGNEENILLDRAAAYVYSDELRRAVRDYGRILKVNPENSKASYGRGLVYVKQKNYEDALKDFQSTVDSDPAYLNAYLQMGLLYSGDDKNDKAVECFTKALNIRKRDDLYYERALANYSLGQFDSALSDMSAAIGMNSKRKEYYNDRGYIYLKLNNIEKARADFQKALKLDPGYDLAKQNLEKLTQNQN